MTRRQKLPPAPWTSETREEWARFEPLVLAAFGPRVRRIRDAEGWPLVPGQYGRIEWRGVEAEGGAGVTGTSRLYAYTDRPRMIAKLRAIPGAHPHQIGDKEAAFWIAADDQPALQAVGVLLRLRVRRLPPPPLDSETLARRREHLRRIHPSRGGAQGAQEGGAEGSPSEGGVESSPPPVGRGWGYLSARLGPLGPSDGRAGALGRPNGASAAPESLDRPMIHQRGSDAMSRRRRPTDTVLYYQGLASLTMARKLLNRSDAIVRLLIERGELQPTQHDAHGQPLFSMRKLARLWLKRHHWPTTAGNPLVIHGAYDAAQRARAQKD